MEAPIERSTVNPLIFFLSLRPILNPAQLNLQLDQALEALEGLPIWVTQRFAPIK